MGDRSRRVVALLVPPVVLAGELVTLSAIHSSAPAAALHAAVAGSTLLLSHRRPAVAFVVALVLSALSGGAYVLLLWTSFRAGRLARSRAGAMLTVGAAVGGLGAPITAAVAEPETLAQGFLPYLVFVLLPLVAGRYLRQHAELVTALSERNHELRRTRELSASRERLQERLRIARDMHDALGHRLGLVSVQAAALEVADLPPAQRQAVERLAGSARQALSELHEVVGSLRQGDDVDGPGLEDIDALVGEWARAGVAVRLDRRLGMPSRPRAVERTAYRVVEEGVTNAVRHAPAQPVTVTLEDEADALLITIENPRRSSGPGRVVGSGGTGLTGVRERVEALGGFASLHVDDDRVRLVAVLPVPSTDPDAEEPARSGRAATVLLGAATAVLLFGVVPAAMLVGVG